jgi:catecholate siderophore receptor
MESENSQRGRITLGLASFGVTSLVTVSGAFGQTMAATADGASGVETVNVTARRTSLDKLTGTVLNTPQSINVVTQAVIEQQGVTNLQDALKNVPGITLNSGEGGAHGDQVNLRGFSASDDFFIDGMRDPGFYTRDSFDLDSLEVLKGPASTLFGRGSTGGVINQVSKMPELYPIENGIITVGTNNEFRGTADVNYQFGDNAAFRLNAMGETSDIAGRPFAENRRWGVAPSIAFGIDTPTTFTLNYLHQTEDNIPDFGIPFINGEPAHVSHKAFYGLPSDDRVKSTVDVVTGTLKHDFNQDFSITQKARYGNYYFDTRMTAPHLGDANCYTGAAPYAGGPVCTGAAGQVPVTTFNPLNPTATTPLADVFVERDRPSASGTVKTLASETDATWKFLTGAISHTLVFGVELDHEEAALLRYANQDGAIVPTPLLDPDPHEAFPGHQTTISQRPDTKADTTSLYAVDTISFDEHWDLIAGVRWDRFDATYNEPIRHQNFHATNYITSPRAALVYKPDENSSLYVSYGTSFDPSAENLSLSSRTANLPPETDRTFEVGGKTLVMDGLLSLTGALFDTEMDNARIGDPLNPGLQLLAGNLHVKGAEADIAGHITDNWEVIAGYTYFDGTSKGLFGPGLSGPIPNTTKNQANLWTVYDFDSGVDLGLGANYMGRRDAFEDSAGFISHAPGFVTFDGMVSYKISDQFTVQANIYNIFNKFYYSNVYFSSDVENHAVPGAGRYATVSLKVSL